MQKKKRNKFSIDQKEVIVTSILKGKESYSSAARKYQTCHRLISLWFESYKVHGREGLTMKNNVVYTGKFKLSLIQEMLNEGLSLQQLSVKYLISPSIIRGWKKQYEKDGISVLFKTKPRGRPPKMKKKAKNKQSKIINSDKDLLKENERLRAENDYLKKLQALIQKQESQKKD